MEPQSDKLPIHSIHTKWLNIIVQQHKAPEGFPLCCSLLHDWMTRMCSVCLASQRVLQNIVLFEYSLRGKIWSKVSTRDILFSLFLYNLTVFISGIMLEISLFPISMTKYLTKIKPKKGKFMWRCSFRMGSNMLEKV